MKITEEEFGGVLVLLTKSDDLRAVPSTHQPLLTAEIKSWWRDPVAAMRNVAERAPSPRMGAWFRAMADRKAWCLELHQADHGATRAGFTFMAPGIRMAEVGPPKNGAALDHLPADLAAYYRLVGHVDWMGFGAAGSLASSTEHEPLTTFAYAYRGKEVDPAQTRVFGWSPCGSMMFYTADGRGGWFSSGSCKIHLLGSVLDTIDWVYGELLADRCPDFHSDRY